MDWKRNLHIVLAAEKIRYVLTDPNPKAPLEDASEDEKKAYEAWKARDEYAKCIILESMGNVLQQQHVGMDTASAIMYNLADMFANQGRQARLEAMRKLMNLRMKLATLFVPI